MSRRVSLSAEPTRHEQEVACPRESRDLPAGFVVFPTRSVSRSRSCRYSSTERPHMARLSNDQWVCLWSESAKAGFVAERHSGASFKLWLLLT